MAAIGIQVLQSVVAVLLLMWIAKKLLVFVVGTQLYKRLFAAILNRIPRCYNKLMNTQKQTLFSQLRESLRNVGGDILEIGAGPGANFQYFPEGSSVIALDPSTHCRDYFEKNQENFSRVEIKRFVIGCAEDMSELEDDCVAAVVCTLTMCSMRDKRQALQEIKRVLKPVSIY